MASPFPNFDIRGRIRASLLGAALALASVGLGGLVGNGAAALGCMPAGEGGSLVARTHVGEDSPATGGEIVEDGDHGDATEPISRLARARRTAPEEGPRHPNNVGANHVGPNNIAAVAIVPPAAPAVVPAPGRRPLERAHQESRRIIGEILLCVGRSGVDPPCTRS
jgi:hypothetical protein